MLLDRIRARIETDLSDVELQAMADQATAEIERRYGAVAAITVSLAGGGEVLQLTRPMDTALSKTVVEILVAGHGGADSRQTLAADDYRVLHGGRTLQRLADGTNGRSCWAPEVEISYTPVSDSRQREEVTIKLVQLDLNWRGLTSERAGDWQAAYPDVAAEREKLLASLAPRGGLVMA